jgi:hypothetical protein
VLKVKRDRGDASASRAIRGFFSSAAAEERAVGVMVSTITREVTCEVIGASAEATCNLPEIFRRCSD